MLNFTVNDPYPARVAGRFVAVVNRLPPPGWRFAIEPTPRVVPVSDPLGFTSSTSVGYTLLPGFGRLQSYDSFGALAPLAAAQALIHAVQESQARETTPTVAGFETRHAAALDGMEAYVGGGRRLGDGSVRATVCVMRGQTVLRGRLAGFRSLEAFRSGAPQ